MPLNTVGVVGCEDLARSLAELGFGVTTLSPSAASPEFGRTADMAARLQSGRKIAARVRQSPPDVLLDAEGAGLTFVEAAPGDTNVRLVHEVVDRPLISVCSGNVGTLFPKIPWSVLWQSLHSPRWIKAFADAAHVAELRRLGIGNVLHLPSAALLEATDSPTAEATDYDVAFVGDACVTGLSLASVTPFGPDWVGRVASAMRSSRPAACFYDLYHSVLRCAPEIAASDSMDRRIQKSYEYFRAKQLYLANLALSRRDRFVLFLSKRLGERFQIIGRGWDSVYGIPCRPPFSDQASYVEHLRRTPMNLALPPVDGENGVERRHFDVSTAGGFLLCLDDPELRASFDVERECAVFSEEDSLLARIDEFSRQSERRREVARAGRLRAHREHLLLHRIGRLMQLQANEGVPHTRTPLNRAAEGEARKDAAVHSGTDAGSLLVLLNPGRVTRNCLLDMIGAARALGLRVLTYELGPLWEMRQSGRQPDASAFAEWLRANNVKAVLGYAHNGLLEFPVARTADGRTVSFFEQLGIPHLMWWTDHPQWASERIALQADLQPLLASENQFHIVKSEAAAREIRGILGWRNVHGMPVAENPDRYGAKDPAEPDFDIVCISGAPPSLDPTLAKPLERDDPDSTEIMRFVEGMVNRRLESLWRERAPARLVVDLDRLGRAWSEGRRIEPLAVCFDLFDRLSVEHPDAANWLRSEYRVYFDALEILWEFGRWQRTFYLRYLSRYFKVGVFGSDWSSVEMGPGGWVDYDQQANIYARGRVALNIPQAGDEQGVAHKPFQIAAANVPMAHLFRKGIEDCFELGEEVLTFQTPREARDRIAALLGDAKRRETMAAAAHARLRRDHTWLVRLPEMLALLPHRFKTDRPDELAGTVPETPRSRAERPLQPA